MSRDPVSPAEPNGGTSRWPGILFAAVLILFAVQNVASMGVTSATSDETSHLPAGYSYLRTGDFRLNPQHPPLAKILAALPLLALGPRMDTADPGWTATPPEEWGFGYRFLYANDADRLLFWGRIPIVLLGLLACLYVRLWARDLYGEAAGVAAAAMFALCPTIVAHAHLVTMDVALAAFTVACLYHLRTYCVRGALPHLFGAGFALGLALATKFSAVVYVSAVGLVLAFAASPFSGPRGVQPGRASRLAPTRAAAALGLVMALAAVTVWIVYGCPGDALFYVNGLGLVNKDHDPTVPSYLLGEFRNGGFWSYFPAAFAFKTPIPTLFSIAAGMAALRRVRSPSILDEVILFLPAALFLAATCAMAANIGVRYLIPIYPPLLVSASRVVPCLLRSVAGRAAVAGLLLWLVVGAARIHPDYLAYFNEAVGGPERGPDLLDDSNLDWGGGLVRLKRWMDANDVETIRLLYPWNGSPTYYGIRHERVTSRDWLVEPSPGIYAVSPMALVRGRLPAREEGARSDWLDRYTPVDRIGYAFLIYRFGPGGTPAGSLR